VRPQTCANACDSRTAAPELYACFFLRLAASGLLAPTTRARLLHGVPSIGHAMVSHQTLTIGRLVGAMSKCTNWVQQDMTQDITL